MDTVLAQWSEAERLGDVLGEPVADVRVVPWLAAPLLASHRVLQHQVQS